MKKGIAVIGRVAEGVELLDGQTIKTKVLCEELHRYFPDRKLICVDTYQYRKNILKILFRMARSFVECEDIFVLLSRNGRTFFIPVLMGMNMIFHRRIYHDVVGGALPAEAAERPILRKLLKCFNVNWVEFAAMKEELEKIGVTNVEVLPNFKRLNILSSEKLLKNYREPFVFSMFSRVLKEKGMPDAAKAVAKVNCRYGKQLAVLHIYGPVEEDYREEFTELLEEYRECVHYMGCVPFDQSVEVLSQSYMLLFPSVYFGEGMPGTILDAFSSGLPVIATDWHFNSELVHDGVTGYCYDWRKPELLEQWICYAIEHPDQINSMREHCLAKAAEYTPEIVMEKICRRMKR